MRRGEHALQCQRERREDPYKRDDALALVDLDFGILDGTDLLVQKLVEKRDQFLMQFLQTSCEILLT